ncbi:MAG: DUF3459 domain-containing protein [Caldilineae bacterium]|nr:MAG: DUF3459 domain-containing protein [Caldilineae bacterium]
MNQSPAPLMQDFVFGALEANEQTLENERLRWRGLRHLHRISPLDPRPGEPVTLRVSVGRDVLVDRLSAYVTCDGSDPKGNRGVAVNGFHVPLEHVETLWQPICWDYVDIWQGVIPGQPEDTHVRYRIEGWHSRDREIRHWSMERHIDGTADRPALYGYSVDTFAPPEWAHEAVVYQIFVDRFAPVAERWLEPEELEQFHGGNLRGIIERLDYLADLGVTALWLSPIFHTTSYHGYDTVDYYRVDPHFGTNEDLKELVQAAHRRDLHVILDFVANHTSDRFAPFQEALHDPTSPKRAWYSFGPEYVHGYRTFFTSKRMPQLDLDNPEARRFILDAAGYWLREYGIDGYRLDYAAGPSHDFWSAFYAACKRIRPDCWLFGEVTLGDEALRTYSGRLDGCLDFGFTRQLRRLCLAPAGELPAVSAFAAYLERSRRYFPEDYTRPSFLDNHDMNRFLWMAGNDRQRLRLAAALMFAFGGPPILYYGTEVGLSQPRSKGYHREESRHPMLWGDRQDADLLAWFRRWIALRRQHPALSRGDVETLHCDDGAGLWLARRRRHDDEVLIAVNLADREGRISLPEGHYRMETGTSARGEILLPARSVCCLAQEHD